MKLGQIPQPPKAGKNKHAFSIGKPALEVKATESFTVKVDWPLKCIVNEAAMDAFEIGNPFSQLQLPIPPDEYYLEEGQNVDASTCLADWEKDADNLAWAASLTQDQELDAVAIEKAQAEVMKKYLCE